MSLITITVGLTSVQVTNVTDAIQLIRDIFSPYPVSFTAEEKKNFFRMGFDRDPFAEQIMNIASQHSETIPPDVVYADVKMLYQFYKDLKLIKSNKSDVDERIDDLIMNVGIQMLGYMNRIYNTAQELAKKGNYPFNELVKEAGKIYKKGPRSSGTQFSIAEGGQVKVSKIKAKSDFVNGGNTVLSFTWADEVSGKFKKEDAIVVNPGNSAKIPEGYTTIVVFNMSTDKGGSFTVKLKK